MIKLAWRKKFKYYLYTNRGKKLYLKSLLMNFIDNSKTKETFEIISVINGTLRQTESYSISRRASRNFMYCEKSR